MDFVTAVKTVFKKYATFEGRACRSEYWYFILFIFIASLVLQVVDLAITGGLLYIIFALATLVPCLAVAVRRLHDTDRSGWWYLIGLVPVVGAIVLIVWFCSRGSVGDNSFGADPLAAPVEAVA